MFVKYIYIYIYEQYNPEMINQNTPKLKHFILIKKTNSYTLVSLLGEWFFSVFLFKVSTSDKDDDVDEDDGWG
jgi:hypothetical protein